MNTTALTNQVSILTDFEIRLCHNGETGDQRMTLACAPVAQDASTIAWYVITNGDDSPLAVQNDNGIFWGTEAFGSLDASDEWLAQESGWLNADAVRAAIADLPSWGNYENLNQFANALESLFEDDENNATVTVWEKTDDYEAVEREFEIDGLEIENAREYCRWANDNAGREIYFTYNPDAK